MTRKIKIAQYGCGKMGKLIMDYALKKGCEIVAALDDNTHIIGADIGTLMGIRPLGVGVGSPYYGDALLSATKPDVLIVATQSSLAELENAYSLAINNGINLISTGEEATFPWNSNPQLAKKIDCLAKKAHCTVTASGYSDYAWGSMVSVMAGLGVNTTNINGYSQYNIEDYGKALALGHGVGMHLLDFYKHFGYQNFLPASAIDKLIAQGKFMPSYMWNQCGWIGSKLGLEIIDQKQELIPIIAPENIISPSLNLMVKSGEVMGMKGRVVAQTAQGVTITTENTGKLYAYGENDLNSWSVLGDPDINFTMNAPRTPQLTAAAIVARIPQVVKAYPGYITTDKLPELNFNPLPFEI